MNILITGASGFVGKALTKELLEGKNNLFLVSRDRKFKVAGIKVFYGDLSDKNFCKKIVKNIDTVYYLAGYKKNIAHHIKYPNDFVLGNIEPLLNFLEATKKSSIKKIIYLSSTNVGLYKDGEKDGYVIGKFINELLLKSFALQSGVDVKIVRVPGIYGPGDNFDPDTANFIPTMIRKINESDGKISVWGSGQRKIQFIFIDDLILNLILISQNQKRFFMIGNPEALTINQIVGKIAELFGKKAEIVNDTTKPDKATELFDFQNLSWEITPLATGLAKTIDYFRKLK